MNTRQRKEGKTLFPFRMAKMPFQHKGKSKQISEIRQKRLLDAFPGRLSRNCWARILCHGMSCYRGFVEHLVQRYLFYLRRSALLPNCNTRCFEVTIFLNRRVQPFLFVPLLSQPQRHLATAEERSSKELLIDQTHQPQVLLALLASLVVVRATR